MVPSDTSSADWLIRAADKFTRRYALITRQGHLDFFSLFTRSGQLLARYSADGLRLDQPVAVITQYATRLAWMAYLSIYSGCPLVPLDPRRRSHMALLENCGINQVITDSDHILKLPSYLHRMPSEWSEESLDTAPMPPFQGSSGSAQFIIATSGTCGTPKGVMLSNRNLNAAVTAARQRLGLTPDDIWLACLPLFHIGGLSILLRCLQAGAVMLLHERFDPAQVWKDLLTQRVTHLSLVPAMLSRLLNYSAQREPPKELRVVLVGGGALSHGLAQRAHRVGWPICPTYGMSETGSQVATRCYVSEHWRAGDVGKPLSGARVDIVDEWGRLTNAQGRIQISGPMVMTGYANRDGVSGEGLTGNAYISNDLGYFDEAGHLHVIGRADDVLISGGETIHPQEVEAQLLGCPGVDDVAVTAYSDETWGQCLIAMVSGSVEQSMLRAWCESKLPSFQRPRRFVRVTKLPRTRLGKLDRGRLSQWINQP